MANFIRISLNEAGGSRELTAPAGESLLRQLDGCGVRMSAPCGGNGRCGNCALRVTGALPEPTQAERRLLSDKRLADGVRLACETVPIGDVTVWLDDESRFAVQTDGLSAAVERLRPPVWAERRTDGWALTDGTAVLRRTAEKPAFYGCAVDVGTTTVVVYLYDLSDGRRVDVTSGLSAQRPFGADVISRIQACMDGHEDRLQAAVIGQLNEMIAGLCAKVGAAPDAVCAITLCGNPTMQHLVCGLDPAGIARAPFTPADWFGRDFDAAALGLKLCPGARVYILPSISGYVGGDITAGVLATGMHKTAEISLLLDIGTNGEMALGNREKVYYCSTAAGPAFEGAQITDGVGGIPGAISKVAAGDGVFITDTIGSVRPAVGICGSGIIDATAVGLAVEAIDETGRLVDPDEINPAFASCLDDENRKLILDPVSGIGLTDQDVRQIQLAKAAIAAGIDVLLARAEFDGRKIELEDVAHVWLAGGFGTKLDPASGCAIGLLPPALLSRVTAVGNSAGTGAIMALLDTDCRARLEALRDDAVYVELSGDSLFNDRYIENMCFEV